MRKVKTFVTAGVSESAAIKEALAQQDPSLSISDFADKYNLPRTAANESINGTRKPTDATIAALIAELGGTEAEWRELLWQAAKPTTVEAA